MTTRFVCSANSYKEGGRCLAGIEIDKNNQPIFKYGYPKWIRPICNTPHGEIPTNLVSHIKILDIIEIEITSYPNIADYQSENVFFDTNSINIHGRFNIENLGELCENRIVIFGNKSKSVSEEDIYKLTYSLLLIRTNKFEVEVKTYDDNPEYPKYRLVFSYKGNNYNFPITDPDFLYNYKKYPNFIENFNEIFLCLSLGVNYMDRYWKLVAGIIPINKSEIINPNKIFDDIPF